MRLGAAIEERADLRQHGGRLLGVRLSAKLAQGGAQWRALGAILEVALRVAPQRLFELLVMGHSPETSRRPKTGERITRFAPLSTPHNSTRTAAETAKFQTVSALGS